MQHQMPTSGAWLNKRYIVNNYILLGSLGTGSYAEVRLAKEKKTDGLFAVKILNKEVLQRKQLGKNNTSFDDVKCEIAIMKKLSHPHVLRLYEVMDDPRVNKLYLVLEYMKRGDLMHIQKGDPKSYSCQPLGDREVWHIFRQVAQGLQYLHDQNIVHGKLAGGWLRHSHLSFACALSLRPPFVVILEPPPPSPRRFHLRKAKWAVALHCPFNLTSQSLSARAGAGRVLAG